MSFPSATLNSPDLTCYPEPQYQLLIMKREENKGYVIEGSGRKIAALQKLRSRKKQDWQNAENGIELVEHELHSLLLSGLVR